MNISIYVLLFTLLYLFIIFYVFSRKLSSSAKSLKKSAFFKLNVSVVSLMSILWVYYSLSTGYIEMDKNDGQIPIVLLIIILFLIALRKRPQA